MQRLFQAALSLLPLGLSAATAYISDVQIPYAVHVGSATLEPGHYSIRRTDSSSGAPILLFTSDTGANLITSATAISRFPSEAPDHSQLVLRRDGDSYQLTRIWLKGRTEGVEIMPHAASADSK